jgi:hypothetical protein
MQRAIAVGTNAIISSNAMKIWKAKRQAPAAKLEETHSTLLLRCRPLALQNQCSKNRDSVCVIEANTALCNCHEERRRIDPQLSKVSQIYIGKELAHRASGCSTAEEEVSDNLHQT